MRICPLDQERCIYHDPCDDACRDLTIRAPLPESTGTFWIGYLMLFLGGTIAILYFGGR